MLETDEVDVDFFTPASSTSLANIFKNVSKVDDSTDKTTLKYTPSPAPSEVIQEDKHESHKPTECIFACVTHAYEWAQNTYIDRGKLGFALLKLLKNDLHNLVLYNSSKTTLSCATITSVFAVNMKENVSISYYDNAQKYWSIYAKEYELLKILEHLKKLNVALKEQNEGPHETMALIENKKKNVENLEEKVEELKSSDTDSSINTKTRDSILKRMANMGHSVLPSSHLKIESSDSSDSNESYKHKRTTRHRQLKSMIGSQSHIDKEITVKEADMTNVNKSNISGSNINIYENPNQMVSYKTLDIVKTVREEIPNTGMSDVSMLISEQRVNNSELRININRISDKLDCVLDTLKSKSTSNQDFGASSYQNILVQKLLNEYETKIKNYEEYFRMHNLSCKNNKFEEIQMVGKNNLECNEVPLSSNEQKDTQISELKDEISKLIQESERASEREKKYVEEIANLKKQLIPRIEKDFNKEMEDTQNNLQKSDNVDKIKSIMNDTFQAIAVNFKNEENYTGSRVKTIVATVIKKTTIDAISDL